MARIPICVSLTEHALDVLDGFAKESGKPRARVVEELLLLAARTR